MISMNVGNALNIAISEYLKDFPLLLNVYRHSFGRNTQDGVQRENYEYSGYWRDRTDSGNRWDGFSTTGLATLSLYLCG